jgi:hypothetical protein
METNKYGVQNYQTGLVVEKFATIYEASKKCDELNGKNAHGREDLKEYRTVYLADDKVFDSEREYLNI